MISRSGTDFDAIYSADGATAGRDADDPADSAGTPGPEKRVQGPDDEALATAQQRAEDAHSFLDDAEEALVDAEGLIAVLETKVADFEADETKAAWERAAAREQLAKAQRSATRAGRRFIRAEEQVAAAEDAVRAAENDRRRSEEAAGSEPEPVVLRFASLPVFVEDFVLPNWVHRLGENYAGNWCTKWWEHAEAVTRLEAIWEAFEVMRLQPAPSFSTWLRDHFDPHLRALTASDGAFFRCEAGEHKQVHELKPKWATVAPPEGMFTVEPNAMVQPAGGQGERISDG